jgi:hypothetical protein
MKSRYMLLTCILLLTSSLFVAPGSIYIGMPPEDAAIISSAMMLCAILFAIITVEKNQKDRENEIEVMQYRDDET